MIEWKETNGEFTAACSYDALTESYTVEVTHTDGRHDSATWVRMGYEPRFGMDAQDSQRSIRESEKICVRMENEERLPCGHPVTDDYAHRDPNPGATHFCMSCAKENEE